MNLSKYPFTILFIGITPSILHVSFARVYASSSILHSSTQEKRTISRPSILVESEKNPALLKSEPNSGLTSNDQTLILTESNDSISSPADSMQKDADALGKMHETGYQHNTHTSFRDIHENTQYQNRMTFSFFQSSSSQTLNDIDDDDADVDADDADVDADDHGNTEISPELQNHQTSHQDQDQPILTKPTEWYMLSHYISPESIIYDVIQGVAVGTIICLILATCYSYTYYCCFVRCGLCLDDRLEASILNTKARKRKRIPIPNRRKARSGGRKEGLCSYLCFCREWIGSGGYDGKGFFMPVDTQYADDSSSDDEDEDRHSGVYVYKDNDDHSSLSDGSALTLEYGDDHLHDEYGEITNRINDEKVKIAAKEYFDREELESAKKIQQKSKRKKASREDRTHRSRRSQRSRRSRKSERSHHSRKSKGTQTSSILSSSSEHSSSSSSESDGNVTLEMLEAMTDLKEVEEKVKRSNND